MCALDKAKTFAVVLQGILLPLMGAISADAKWEDITTPYCVAIMILGGARALKDYWSQSPIPPNANMQRLIDAGSAKHDALLADKEAKGSRPDSEG